MAYTTSKTSALQTAIKASVDIGLALLNAGIVTSRDDLDKVMSDYQEMFTAQLYPLVDADNELARSQPSQYRGSRSNTGGGGGAPPSRPIDAAEAADVVLNFGVFKGLTLGQVYLLTADEAKRYAASQGKDYKRTGADWLKWVADQTDDPQKGFIAKRAKAVLDNPPAP